MLGWGLGFIMFFGYKDYGAWLVASPLLGMGIGVSFGLQAMKTNKLADASLAAVVPGVNVALVVGFGLVQWLADPWDRAS